MAERLREMETEEARLEEALSSLQDAMIEVRRGDVWDLSLHGVITREEAQAIKDKLAEVSGLGLAPAVLGYLAVVSDTISRNPRGLVYTERGQLPLAQKLQQKGLVEVNSRVGRQTNVTLTPRGEAAVKLINEIRNSPWYSAQQLKKLGLGPGPKALAWRWPRLSR